MRGWFPQRTICYASMALASANSRYDKLHKDAPYHDGTFTHWSKERGPAHPFHYRDGVTVWVTQHNLTPDDNWLNDIVEVNAETLGPAGQSSLLSNA
jgi:hypothetical protein